jgi:hypothetical protein
MKINSQPTIACERVANDNYGLRYGTLMSCYLKQPVINLPSFRISMPQNHIVKGMSFWMNRNVFYLPESSREIFVNLEQYYAGFCSIKEISIRNFRGLMKVRGLWLHENQIEMIRSDTFEDMKSLEFLNLSMKFIL